MCFIQELNLESKTDFEERKWEKFEELYLGCRKELEGDIPDEIGYLSSLRVLDLCSTKICRVPRTIKMISCLLTLDLTRCDEITELPELPTSLVCLHVQSAVVPNLSKFTNLVDLALSDFSANQNSSNVKHKCDLRWIGRLSKLKELSLYFLKFIAPVPELGLLSLPEHLRLRGLDLQPLKYSKGSPLFNSKVLLDLTLNCSGLQEIQLGGLSQLQHLSLLSCELRSLSIPYSLWTLYVRRCPNMIEIQSVGMSASLKILNIYECRSIGRIVSCSEVGSRGVLHQSESSSIETTDCSPKVLCLPNAFKKLKCLRLSTCENLLEIQVVGTLLSLQTIEIYSYNAMENFSGMSNLKNLHRSFISGCSKMWVAESLDELEVKFFQQVYRIHFFTCKCLGFANLPYLNKPKVAI
ncbi:hypothetical protein ACJRO7_027596 [Eucalyptus globulus]|uniref:Leucine-rich repeat domain, L domain-containing protein n=1 Tax=Eucalyptus globulus TaxID=34317 RepID=A0ABD3JXP1_EUCGL